MKQKIKYETAVKQIEEIVAKLENGEMDIDEMSTQLKKAQELITTCRKKLIDTDKEIKELLEIK